MARTPLSFGNLSGTAVGSSGGNLTFGDGVPSLADSYPWQVGDLSFGSDVPKVNTGPSGWFDGIFNLGTPVTASPEVNTASVDGSSRYAGYLADLSRAVLGSIGGGSDDPQPQQVAYRQGGGGGMDWTTLAIIGLGGAAIYYVASS